MGRNAMLCIVVLSLCCNAVASQETDWQYDLTRTATKPTHHHHCSTCNQNNDKEIAEKAVTTLASMAMSLLNIGADATNPATISTGVISILSSFINFVTFAMKNPAVAELLNDEFFQEELRSYIVRSLKEKHPEMSEDIL